MVKPLVRMGYTSLIDASFSFLWSVWRHSKPSFFRVNKIDDAHSDFAGLMTFISITLLNYFLSSSCFLSPALQEPALKRSMFEELILEFGHAHLVQPHITNMLKTSKGFQDGIYVFSVLLPSVYYISLHEVSRLLSLTVWTLVWLSVRSTSDSVPVESSSSWICNRRIIFTFHTSGRWLLLDMDGK